MIEPTLTWYFPSNWTASQVLEWARLRNLVLNKSDLTLYRGWNGRQFWFTLAGHVQRFRKSRYFTLVHPKEET